MKLFIANVTKQNHLFNYWLAENPKLQELMIPSGEQVAIEATKDALERIIHDHRVYGFVEAREASRTKGFAGIAYQIDKPVTLAVLRDAMERRGTVEDERADTMRRESVAAVHTNMSNVARQVGIDKVGTVVEFQEKQSPESAARGPAMRQTIKVEDKPGQRRRA